ncbi:MAG: hypothetical protein [Bacteriophage sp.]|nr:MAG: hypothetical protein [Bacteriophage sp.]
MTDLTAKKLSKPQAVRKRINLKPSQSYNGLMATICIAGAIALSIILFGV